ncbi:MAG: alanine racemase [Candidatus Berkelbacteria bacterium]|nr:alanine racemase [Candidatus Berkelbacteria bacterium]
MERPIGVRTWLEIDKTALLKNYDTFRQVIGSKVKLMAVAKSNAYGHCLFDYAKTMSEFGVDFLGVDSVTEAMKLRAEGLKTPILILGYTLPERLNDCAENDITVTVSSFDQIDELKAQGGKLKIHLKVDTGMHRQGFQLDEIKDACQQIGQLKSVETEGIFTHFAAAKNPAFPRDTEEQICQFNQALQIAEKYFGPNLIKHAAATAGTLLFPKSHFDMVRIGIGLYGLWTSNEARAYCEDKISLAPALSWKAITGEVKQIKKGERISYDLTETMDKDTTIAVIPIGYWNGFRRSLSSVGHVLIHGKRARVLGRVTMDMIIVDITNISNCKANDIVTLIGRDGDEEITLDEIARLCDTSVYEIPTQLNPLMKRLYK